MPTKKHRRQKKKKAVSEVPDVTASNNFVPSADNNIGSHKPAPEKQLQRKDIESLSLLPESAEDGTFKKINTSVLKSPVSARLSSYLLKIKPKTVDDHCTLLDYLIENKVAFHTLAPKAERPQKVLIRGLPPLTNPNEIKKSLCQKGFFPISVVPLHHRVTKIPLPLYLVNLKPTPGWELIYDINILLYVMIKVQKYNNIDIKQCYRCQGLNHSSLTCTLPPQCISCAGPHISSACTRPKSEPPTCLRCTGNHPANYRGCPMNPARKHPKIQPCKTPGDEPKCDSKPALPPATTVQK